MSSGFRTRGLATSEQRRLANRLEDIGLVERTSRLIAELGRQLDRDLETERRPAYRLRMLRETTNRITRAANDAVQAYARASRAIRAELERPGADVETANAMRSRLVAGRREVLRALELAQQRYDAPPLPRPTPRRTSQ